MPQRKIQFEQPSFTLELYDCKGVKLNVGDIVRVVSGRSDNHVFFAEVTWLKDEQIIAPFHTFSFHAFQKVDKVPQEATKSSETRYNIWYMDREDGEAELFENFLMSWRDCEYKMETRCYRIKLNE